jgi:pilus assembly protein CpaE
MTEPLRIVLATPDAGYEQRLRQTLDAALNGSLQRWDTADGEIKVDELWRELGDAVPDVVAIGPGLALDEAFALAHQLEQERPEISVLLISEPSAELWQQALHAGVRDVLAPEALNADVRAAFDRALELAARRRHNLLGPTEDGTRHGRIITVLSPKGGSGKTTVCTNLAVGLARIEPNNVAVIDLDLQFGDIASALRLTPGHSFVDAVRAPLADAMTLKTFLTPHASNLWSLCGPETPAEGEEITADQAQSVVAKLAEEFAYVVVDTSAGLSEHTLAMIDISTDLVLVCTMDVPSIRNLRKEVDALDQVGMIHQRRHFVMNRSDAKVGLEVADVEATVGLRVDVTIPSARVVPLSTNQGTPLVESQPRHRVAREFGKLVDTFVTERAAVASDRRRRGRSER